MAYGNNPLDQYACKVVKAKDTSILLAPGLPNDMARSQKVRKRRSIGEVDIKLDRKYSESYMKEATVLAKLDHVRQNHGCELIKQETEICSRTSSGY